MGGNRLLTSITVGDANRFRESLAETMAPNTVRRICGRAKQFFKAAVDDDLIAKSPFRAMKDTNVRANKSRDHEVDRAADKVIAACPDAEWRLIFALARFGGFRCPSEHFALRWADVDWIAGTIRLDSPKTGERVLPLLAELRPYLEDAFDAESEFVIVANRRKSNLRTQLMRIVKEAGLKPSQAVSDSAGDAGQSWREDTGPTRKPNGWGTRQKSRGNSTFAQVGMILPRRLG
jgi:integrase